MTPKNAALKKDFHAEASNATEQDPRWERILRRDRTADGLFWYSVITTGIYCRPSCPSRRPHAENACLHATLEEARATGARPCQRCDPDGAHAEASHNGLVARACRSIEASETCPTLEVLAKEAQLSPTYFQRVFKRIVGLSPRQYGEACRAGRVRATLRSSATVTDAIYAAGYASSSRFYEQAESLLGMKPRALHRGAPAERLRFAVGECSLGVILVASSARGVVAILMGDDADTLARDLQDRFPNAELVGADPDYAEHVAQVVALVETPALGLELPLDIRGTAFQQRVWNALRAVPVGQRVTYTDIAKAIGHPESVRAVANACGANALAVAIPCHRVVRRDGALSGYCWGVGRKTALLEREKGS